LARRSGQGCFTAKPARAGPRASRRCARCLRRPSGEAWIHLGLLFLPEAGLGRGEIVSLEWMELWPVLRLSGFAACADGGYQPSLGVLGVPLIMVPDKTWYKVMWLDGEDQETSLGYDGLVIRMKGELDAQWWWVVWWWSTSRELSINVPM
jgi:hypothetical protein